MAEQKHDWKNVTTAAGSHLECRECGHKWYPLEGITHPAVCVSTEPWF